MSYPMDYDTFMESESENSDCECHVRVCCKCELEGELMIETKTTKILLGEVLGCGNFSTVRVGMDVNTGKHCAVKMTPRIPFKGKDWSSMSNEQKEEKWLTKTDDDCLIGEYKSYLLLEAVKVKEQERYFYGLPMVYECGFYKEITYMTMDLLGPDLQDLFIACDYKFTLKTVLQILIQMLKILRYVHSHGVLHRDIKPNNCMIGRRSNRTQNTIYLIDFDNSREYLCRKRKGHIIPRSGQEVHGSVRFASINVHKGLEVSRRDDLESLCYMILYFLNSTLPWQGLSASTMEELWTIVGKTKNSIPILMLCKDTPKEFENFYRYVKKLGFYDKPEYETWIRTFVMLYEENDFENVEEFCWSKLIADDFKEEYKTQMIERLVKPSTSKMG